MGGSHTSQSHSLGNTYLSTLPFQQDWRRGAAAAVPVMPVMPSLQLPLLEWLQVPFPARPSFSLSRSLPSFLRRPSTKVLAVSKSLSIRRQEPFLRKFDFATKCRQRLQSLCNRGSFEEFKHTSKTINASRGYFLTHSRPLDSRICAFVPRIRCAAVCTGRGREGHRHQPT